jgi:hypothetical protein
VKTALVTGITGQDVERFWRRVNRTDGCWLWTGARKTSGYGEINIGGAIWDTHRLAWTITQGPIPDGLCVLHTCDVRPCVNPDHLWLGTIADNNRDMFAKGRNRSLGRAPHPRSTHCRNDHELTPDNVYLRTRDRAGHPVSVSRECRRCNRNPERRERRARLVAARG